VQGKSIVNRRLLLVFLILACVFGIRLWLDAGSTAGLSQPLSTLPARIGAWHAIADDVLSQPVRQVLRADDLLARTYEVIPGTQVQLFIAYYKTQRAGERMHSPRNCLPGSGWEPISVSLINADVGAGRIVPLNRYLVNKEDKHLLVVYWYQEHNRLIADEYRSKLYLTWDSIRKGSRDGALVRVSMPLRPGMDENEATRTILQFIQSATPEISRILPD
jgi:EpsI family protein